MKRTPNDYLKSLKVGACALALALSLAPLTGCNGTTGNDSGSTTEKTEAAQTTDESTKTEDGADEKTEAKADAASSESVAAEPVWVQTSMKTSYEATDGTSSSMSSAYTIDEHGNTIGESYESDGWVTTTESTVDEDGYTTKITLVDEGSTEDAEAEGEEVVAEEAEDAAAEGDEASEDAAAEGDEASEDAAAEGDDVIIGELDEDGNIVITDDSADGAVEIDESDLEGLALEDYSITFTLTKDEQGRLIKQTGTDGSTQTREYDAKDGYLTSIIAKSEQQEYDEEGNPTGEMSTYTDTVTYDKDGFITSHRIDSADSSETISEKYTYTYERDDSGKVIKGVLHAVSLDESGAEIEEGAYDTNIAFEYDENGNISRVVETSDYYTLTYEYTYTKIESPSLNAITSASLRNF